MKSCDARHDDVHGKQVNQGQQNKSFLCYPCILRSGIDLFKGL